MALAWGALAATTAAFLGEKIASEAFGEGWREKVTPQVFERSDLAHELTRGYAQAFEAFVASLRMVFHVDEQVDARLREMFVDEGVQALLHDMPSVPFAKLETERARRLFVVAVPGADDEDFRFVWKALKRSFDEAVAETSQAARLVDTAGVARREALLEEIAARFRPRVRDDTAVLAEYRRYVVQLYRLADTRGLFLREKETAGEELRLADVFVETRLQPPDLRLKEVPQNDEGRGTEDERRPVFRVAPRTVADVMGERRLVILGPPGSGKSTLVRCLALALATGDDVPLMTTGLPDATVPILLALKTYAACLKNDASLKLDIFLKEELGSQLPNLDEILAGERALVLLDGLDEVFDEDHRRWVSDEVWRLMSLYREARFVLTSRPQGYRAAPLPGSVPLFEMVPFDDEQIGRFFRGWFVSLARQGYEHERTPEERAVDLAKDVLGRPQLRSLAENPMLCTLIVLVHRSRSGRLPERRVMFYEAAVALLVEHWEKVKRWPKQEVQLDFPEPELTIGVLAELAWRTQTEVGGGDIPREILEEWTSAALEKYPEWGSRGRHVVSDFIHLIEERVGLLVEIGGERYQCSNRGLHEYLTVRYVLVHLTDEQSSRIARHFLHAPEWEEIIRLIISAAPRVRTDVIIRSILTEPDEWENRIRRDLRFVCRCFEDRPNISQAVREDVEQRWLTAIDSEETLDVLGLIRDGASLSSFSTIRAEEYQKIIDGAGDLSASDSYEVDYETLSAKAVRQDEHRRKSIPVRDVVEGRSTWRRAPSYDVPEPSSPLELTRLDIRNFKNIEHLEIDLSGRSSLEGNWTCVAGINGSGKTSILQAICLLLLGRRRATELGGQRLRKMLRRIGSERRNAELRATVLEGERRHTLYLPLNDDGIDEARIMDEPQFDAIERLWQQLGNQMLLSYGATRNLSNYRDTRHSDLSPVVRRQMTLFDPLTQIAALDVFLEDDESNRPILVTLTKLLKTVLEDNDLGLTVHLDPGNGLVFRAEGSDLKAFDLPDGFRSLVAWLADLCNAWHESRAGTKATETSFSDITGIVLIDEIDLHLHPALQRTLVPRLRAALPNVQWIVTTHSPLVLASFDREELVVLDRNSEDGIRALDRQILGFSVDQVYQWLMGTSPHSSVIEEKLERGDDDVAVLLYQSGERDEEAAKEALARRKERIARLRDRKASA